MNKNKLTRRDSTLHKPFIYNNTVKGDYGLNTGSHSNYSTPTDIFNQNKSNELSESPNEFIDTPSPTWNCGSQIEIPGNMTKEGVCNHRKSSSPVIEVTEKTNNTEISKDKDLNLDRKTVRSSYPSSNSHCVANKSPVKKRSLEN